MISCWHIGFRRPWCFLHAPPPLEWGFASWPVGSTPWSHLLDLSWQVGAARHTCMCCRPLPEWLEESESCRGHSVSLPSPPLPTPQILASAWQRLFWNLGPDFAHGNDSQENTLPFKFRVVILTWEAALKWGETTFRSLTLQFYATVWRKMHPVSHGLNILTGANFKKK